VQSQDFKIINHTNINSAICIEPYGDTIWYGTDGGVVRMLKDGTKRQIFTTADGLTNNRTNALCADKNGGLWAAKYSGGISYYDGKSWSIVEPSIEFSPIFSIEEDTQGNIWFGTVGDGAIKFDGKTWTQYSTSSELASSHIYTIKNDSKGVLWFGTDIGIKRFNGSAWKTLPIPDTIFTEYMYCISFDKEGTIWIGTKSLIGHLKDDTWEFFTPELPERTWEYRDIEFDSEGTMYVSSNRGLLQYRNGEWSFVSDNKNKIDSYNTQTDKTIATDNNGDIWIAAGLNGAMHLSENNWTAFKQEEGKITDNIKGFLIDNNNIKWFFSDNRLLSYNDTVWTYHADIPYLIGNCIALDNEGAIWTGTKGGLLKYTDTAWKEYSWDILAENENFYDMKFDQNNDIWLIIPKKILHYDHQKWEIINTKHKALEFGAHNIFIDNKGKKWFTTNSGVVCYDNCTWSLFTEEDGIPSGYIQTITSDIDGNVWLIADYGIAFYNGLTWEIPLLPAELQDVAIENILIDSENNTYAVTKTAVVKFNNKEILAQYDYSRGFVKGIYYVAIDHQGVKWFVSTHKGASQVFDNGTSGFYDNKIRGTVFFDSNKNGMYDEGEQPLPNQYVMLLENQKLAETDTEGTFGYMQKDGNYTMTVLPEKNWECTSPKNISFKIKDGNTQTALSFGLAPISPSTDVVMTVEINSEDIPEDTQYWITLQNTGDALNSTTLTLDHSPLLTFKSSTIKPEKIEGNIITWNIENLSIFEKEQILIDFEFLENSVLGKTIVSIFCADFSDNKGKRMTKLKKIKHRIEEPNGTNRMYEYNGKNAEELMQHDDTLNYAIHFQNTGNDTIFCIKIVDTLNANLDYSTFKLNSCSHSHELQKNNGILVISFRDTLLPNSTTNRDESKGFVNFSICAKKDIPDYTTIDNMAYVYYNNTTPAETNIVSRTIVKQLPEPVTTIFHKKDLSISPNPSSHYIISNNTVSSPYTILSVLGTIIDRGKISDNGYINIQKLEQGMYYLQIDDKIAPFIKK